MYRLPCGVVLGVAACGSSVASDPMTAPPVGPVTSVELVRTTDDTGTRYSIPNTLVALESPALGQPLGLPTSGRGLIALDLHLTGTDLRTAEGALSLGCPAGCAIGDDRAKIPITKNARSAMFAPDGIAFGHLTVDHFATRITVVHGRAEIASFEWASPDVDLVVSGGVTLAATLDQSRFDVCLRFKPTAALTARDPKTATMLALTGAPLDTDGRYDIRIEGPLGDLRRLGQVCGGATAPAAPPPATADVTPTTTPTPAAEPTESVEVSAKLAARLDAGIHATSPTSFEVSHELVDLVGTNVATRGARIVPAMRAGKPDGMKLYAVRKGSVYDRLGLQNGDTIEAVDGRAISSADEALAASTAISKATAGATIVVTGTRRGQPLTLAYHIR